jgi:hypothetical protein
MNAINGLPAAFTEIARLQKEVARLQAQVAAKEEELLHYARHAGDIASRWDREVSEMRAECEKLRIHKIQVEGALAMLGTDDPTNVIIRLETEARELRAKVAGQDGHIKVLEAKLAVCDESRIAKLEEALSAARAETDSLKMALQEARTRAQAAEYEYSMERDAADDDHRGEIYELERELEHLRDQLRMREKQFFEAEEETMATRGKLDSETQENVRLNKEVTEYADAVDELKRHTRELQDYRDDARYWEKRYRNTWQKGQRLWRGREMWKARCLAAEARKPLDANAPEFVPAAAAKRPLDPNAPEFTPSVPAAPKTLKDAVIARLAEKKAEEERQRAATVEAMKEAVRARLAFKEAEAAAEKPSMTVTELETIPDHIKDWLAYKSYCVKRVQALLHKCDAAKGRENKCAVATEMFRFHKDHGMPFNRAHQKFYYVLIAKCWELLGENPTGELKELLLWHIKESKDYVTPHWTVCEDVACCRMAHAKLTAIARDMSNIPVMVVTASEPVPVPDEPAPAGPVTRSRAGPPVITVTVTDPAKSVATSRRYRTRTRTGAIPRVNYAGMEGEEE